MADIHIPDLLLHNILTRLPAKSLLRFRCVSTHWNHLISDPYFLKSRSRPMILLPKPPDQLYALNKLPVDDDAPLVVNLLDPPLEYHRFTIVGTFNGIVLLVLTNFSFVKKMVLYNPFTSVSKILPIPPWARRQHSDDIYGFGYGATPDDLKIIIGRGKLYSSDYDSNRNWNNCDVYSLKTGSWSTLENILPSLTYKDDVGVFLNGFLYWVYISFVGGVKENLVALDVEEMVASTMHMPNQYFHLSSALGILHGRLCTIKDIVLGNGFDVWVMKEQGVENSWSKEFSVRLAFEDVYGLLQTVCILEDGRIVVIDRLQRFIICDPSKGTYKRIKGFTSPEIIFKKGVQYIESLVSPSDIWVV
ncbi:putative F-box protein At3g16210 [Cynara cardunculus var. scolymus]|uniref:putative F-box protein At3g16210 n=1 Tax=Cynara cardunculus var. scolymus TaxID=59895 RepID=UPI000D62A3B0|nr:putative F-box protein At3g16210 [Cynara cardunculus var. scolymus]